MAEEGAERGDQRELAAEECAAISTATVPLSASPSSVAAASPLRPVRSTLVAPILPEPIGADVRRAREPGQQEAERESSRSR